MRQGLLKSIAEARAEYADKLGIKAVSDVYELRKTRNVASYSSEDSFLLTAMSGLSARTYS